MWVLLLMLLVHSGSAARILFVVGTPSYSHQVIFQPIWRELSLRGHQVTAITSNPIGDPSLTNLTELDMNFAFEVLERKYNFVETLDALKDDAWKFASFFVRSMSAIHEEQLAHPDVQRLIHDEGVHFDLVMAEFLLPTMLAFGHRFDCPIIALTSLDATISGHDAMGNPSHPALNPDAVLKFAGKLTFAQRVISTIYAMVRRLGFKILVEKEDQIVARQFGEGYPSLREIIDRIDMFFMNVNLAFHNVRPTVPAVVHIGGGIHLKPPKPLPQDLKNFLDKAKDGAIYFSLGTNVRTRTLADSFKKILLQAFEDLPYKVLWKLDEDLPEKPANVLVKSWVPQQDVLRHPNVKAFISQGGLQSIEEALMTRVPVICFPYFGDQFSNALQAAEKGFGIVLDHKTIDASKLKNAIVEIISNTSYNENVNRLADIAEDQPMTGLEKAVWWTEYVLRHKGAKHLRSPSADVPLYQYFLLDVLAFFSLVLVVVSFVASKTVKIFWMLVRRIFGSKAARSDDCKKKQKVL